MTRTKRLRLNLNRGSHIRKLNRLESKGWRVVGRTQWGLYTIVAMVKS